MCGFYCQVPLHTHPSQTYVKPMPETSTVPKQTAGASKTKVRAIPTQPHSLLTASLVLSPFPLAAGTFTAPGFLHRFAKHLWSVINMFWCKGSGFRSLFADGTTARSPNRAGISLWISAEQPETSGRITGSVPAAAMGAHLTGLHWLESTKQPRAHRWDRAGAVLCTPGFLPQEPCPQRWVWGAGMLSRSLPPGDFKLTWE